MKISKEVFIIIQYFIEQYIVDLLRDSNFAAIHACRVKLMSSDISFITSLRNKSFYKHKQTETTLEMSSIDEKENTIVEEEKEEEQKEDELVEEN